MGGVAESHGKVCFLGGRSLWLQYTSPSMLIDQEVRAEGVSPCSIPGTASPGFRDCEEATRLVVVMFIARE